MKNAVIYTRVSTDEQSNTSLTLRNQEEELRKHCESKGFNVVGHFQDDCSAKTFNRPEWRKLEEFVKNSENVGLILITNWDRFSRDVNQGYKIISQMSNRGIEIKSIK
ncbi:resolvase-like protein [Flavobacterium cauense R2A-7]|uniref:Resolvase-like protein n=1 Tax=Flavobacterium cauense R2A-7 TaxID=1341154 RepID=A0A562LP64_9FLAO|nr:recombinase family protein [Flavobacterium cauense]KGO80363.1 hypothetical protein Q762_12065 [Flavobacterium cauense R2A-7]TWI09368.1 resolvase-like protein [Flavobacterium cauense R2A-7]